MSASVLSKRSSSPYQTRRAPIRDYDIENNDQRQHNRRSLSGRFRNFFRKNSSSPSHSTINNGRSTPATSRQRSPSPESSRTAMEAPHLRAPTISWPFGKKKPKHNRKTNRSPLSSIEISSPIYPQEYQTSIRGQNFVPRTPDVTHTTAGRTQSSSSYEAVTKGFRDYTIIDNSKSMQQVILPDIDAITPPPYVSDHSRSPSLNRRHFYDKNIEHSYHHDSVPRISDIEIIPIQKQEQHIVGDIPLLNTTQILVEQSPLLSRKVTQPTAILTNSNQWNNTSYYSRNNNEIRSRSPSLKDVDVPKLNAPIMSLSSTSKNKSKRISFEPRYDDTYNSTSTVNDYVQSNQPYTNTYGSLTDTSIIHNGSLKPILSNYNQYPGLDAIIEYHIRPTSGQFSPRTLIKRSTSPTYTQRFDASTTTSNDFEQRKEWSTTPAKGSTTSPASIHRHDGYVRPLTPEKTFVQPDISTIHANLDDLRRQSSPRTSHYKSNTSPPMYRSSTTIFTKDKHNYTDGGGGELRTWSIRKNDDIDNSKISSTSHQIYPLKINNKQEEGNIYEYERQHQPQYSSINRYSDNIINSNLTRSSILNEREKTYDQSTRLYKDPDYTQEHFKSITPVKYYEGALRHYTLKRTDSYDGLGIIISADSETRLNHRIREIENGSPGSRAGLRKNDRIVRVNGVNIENVEFGDVLLLIQKGLANNDLQFSVINESILL